MTGKLLFSAEMNLWWVVGRIKFGRWGNFSWCVGGGKKWANFCLIGRGFPPSPQSGKFWLIAHCTLVPRVMGLNLLHSWSHIHHLQSCCNQLGLYWGYQRDWLWSLLEKGSSKLLLVSHVKISNHNHNIIQESSPYVFVTDNVSYFELEGMRGLSHIPKKSAPPKSDAFYC